MEYPIDIRELQSIEIFQDLDSSELEEIVAIMTPMQIHECEQLTRQGEPAHTFFVVISGNFMLYLKDGRAMTLHGKGQVIGWSTAVTPFLYAITAIALTDGEVMAIEGQELLRVVQGDSALGDKLMGRINDAVAERIAFIQNKDYANEEEN